MAWDVLWVQSLPSMLFYHFLVFVVGLNLDSGADEHLKSSEVREVRLDLVYVKLSFQRALVNSMNLKSLFKSLFLVAQLDCPTLN